MFKGELLKGLRSNTKSSESYEVFENIFLRILNKHAPLKTKIIRGNHAPYMNTMLRKAIMMCTQLQNHYYKSKNSEDFRTFKKQRNFVSRLYKKQRRTFYNNIDFKKFTDNKKFWKNVNPLLSGKSKTQNKISLVEQNKIITDDRELAQTFNDFFKNAVTNLNLDKNIGYEENTNGITDPVEVVVCKLKNHTSIHRIKEIVREIHTYCKPVTENFRRARSPRVSIARYKKARAFTRAIALARVSVTGLSLRFILQCAL